MPLLAPLILLGLAAFLLGLVLLGAGVGRRVGSAWHCGRCRFDLTGLYDPLAPASGDGTSRCPECGGRLVGRVGVQRGVRRRRPVFLAVGGYLVLLVFTLPLAAWIHGGGRFNWVAYAPSWLLISRVDEAPRFQADRIATELAARRARGDLSDAQLVRVFDAALAMREQRRQSLAVPAWSTLLGAAFDAGVVTPEQRATHLAQLFGPSTFQSTNEVLRDRFVKGERIPRAGEYGRVEIVPRARNLNQRWLARGQVYGVSASLSGARLNDAALALVEAEFGSPANSPQEGWWGSWRQFGVPNGDMIRVTTGPTPRFDLAPFTAPVGKHRLTLTWDVHVFQLRPGETSGLHPFREPDHTVTVTLSHDFEVVSSYEELADLVRPSDEPSPPLPSLPWTDAQPTLYVTEARRLRRDGDWYYMLDAQLANVRASPSPHYTLLMRPHLEIAGHEFHSRGFPDWFMDFFRISGGNEGDNLRLFLVDLPRVETADLVLTPAPDLLGAGPFGTAPPKAIWAEPIIVRDVRIDWSGMVQVPGG